MTTFPTSTPSMSPVPFHGKTLFVVERDGQPYAPMRPIVEGMGLDWSSQHAKIKVKAERFCMAIIATQMPGDDQHREVVCLPLRKLPGWLMTINPSKVAPKLRPQVVLYQNECDDALWDFWTKGQATNKRMVEAGEAEAARPTFVPIPEETETVPLFRPTNVTIRTGERYNERSSAEQRRGVKKLIEKINVEMLKVGISLGEQLISKMAASQLGVHSLCDVIPEDVPLVESYLKETIQNLHIEGPLTAPKLNTRVPRAIPIPARLEPSSKNASDRIEEIVESLTRACQGSDKFIYDVEHDVEKIIKDELAKIDFMSMPAMERHETMEMVRELARSFREQTHQIIVAHNAVRPILRAMARIAKMTESRMAGQYGSPAALPSGRGRPIRKALGR